MSLWILLYIISGFDGYQGNTSIATATVVFHSKEACFEAAKHFRKGYCFEDPLPPKETEGK